MWRVSRQSTMRYGVAILSVAVSLLLKLAILQVVHIEAPFLIFFAAVTISTWYGGVGPGLLAAFLSAASATLFITRGAFGANAAPLDVFQLVLFFLEAMLIVGLSGTLREVKRQNESSETQKEEAYALLDTLQVYAPIGLAFLDNDLRYVRINYAMAELNGLTPAAHIGRTIQEVQPQITPETIAGIERVIQTGKPLLDQEFSITKPTILGAKTQHLLTSYYRIRSTDGKAFGVGAVMVDITQIKQAEAALRESEARFQTMANTAPVMIWMSNVSKQFTYVNKVWLDFTGRTLDSEVGNGWLESIHPDDTEIVYSTYRTQFDAREEFKVEYRLRRFDGEYRWVLDHGIPHFGAGGAFIGYIGSCIDIDEHKQTETNQRFLVEASTMLASSLDYETTLANVANLAVPKIGDWCAIDLLMPDQSLKRLAVAHVDSEKVKWAYELSEKYPVNLDSQNATANVVRTGESAFYPIVDDDMMRNSTQDPERYEISKIIGFTSAIIVPLTVRGRILGALTLVSAESGRHYTERELTLAQELARRAAIAVDNARLYEQARAERERFETTLASIGDAVIATDKQGIVTFINSIAEQLTGWETQEALGKPLGEIFHIVNDQDRQEVESPVKRVLREGRIVGLANHTLLISKSGQETPIDDSGAPIPDKSGGIDGVVLVFRDVTERQRAEKRREFLAEAASQLISTLDYEKTLQHVTRLAVPALADTCYIYLKQADGTVRQVAMFTNQPDIISVREKLVQHYQPSVDDSFGYLKVIATGKSDQFVITDELLKSAASNDEHLALLRQLNYYSSISVPIRDREETFGALTLATHRGGHLLNEEDLATAEELGHIVSLAISNTRLYTRTRLERERFLTTLASIGDAVIATDDQGQVTFVNHIAETLTGWQQPEAIGKPLDSIFNIVNEQSRDPVENPVTKVLREGNVVGLANHTVLISKSGDETPIDDSGAPIPALDGSIGGVVLVFRDISERKRREERQHFLYEASNLLSTSLDYETTLQNVTRLAVPALADWCIVHIADETGEAKQVALYTTDPQRAAIREEMMRRYPPIQSDAISHTAVISSGEPELIEAISEDMLRAATVNDEHLEMFRSLHYKSSLSVPLKTVDRVFGTLTLRTNQGGKTLTEDDLALAIELGHVVSLAIENARLYRLAQNRQE